RAWTIPAGATAPQAAGVIHTDFERGFIRAEVAAYDDFVATVASRARKRRESCASKARITSCATATSSTSASTSRIAAMELQYGQATVKDLPQLVELLHVLFTDEAEFQPNAEKQRRALEAILANPALDKVFVAREGKRVVAMASLL